MGDPLRVLYVHNSADIYGASRSLLRLLQGLDRGRYTPVVIVPGSGPLVEKLRALQVEVITYPHLGIITREVFHSWRLIPFLLNIPRSVLALWRMIKRRRIDLVHTNTGVIISPAFGAWLAGIPHIWHVRDWFQEFDKLWRFYAATMQATSSRIIAISQAVAGQFPRSEKVVVIYNGLALPEYAIDRAALRKTFRQEWQIAPDDLVVSCVGRIKLVRKGQEILIRAAALLQQRGVRAIFVIAGSPYREFAGHLRQLQELAATLHVTPVIIFTGELPDTRAVYAASDIFVLPSAQAEPLGNVVMEAMAMNLPVIATNIGGPPEQIVEGITGFLVPPADAEALADKLELLARDAELRARLGDAGRRRVAENFTIERTTANVQEVYARVAVRGGARARVLYVNNVADIYGASRCLVRLLTQLDRTRFEPIVLLPEDGPLRPLLEGLGVPVILHSNISVLTRPVIRSWRLGAFLLQWPLSVWFIWRLIRRERIALVHTNTGVMVSPCLAARLAGVPHLWHIREWFGDFQAFWPYYRRYIASFSSCVLTISHAVASQFKASPQVRVIHDGLDMAEFALDLPAERRAFRARYGLGEAEVVVGCVGRIKWVRKGQDDLVKAAALFQQRRVRAKFLIVGSPFPGNEDHLVRLEALARELGVADDFVFAGELSDPRPAYAGMDILVLPSADPEPFGMVIVEAMAMHLPVVATNLGGPLDQVLEGVTGFLVPPGDPPALAEKLGLLIQDGALRERFGAAGRARVSAHFTLESTARNIEVVYQECLFSKDGRAADMATDFF